MQTLRCLKSVPAWARAATTPCRALVALGLAAAAALLVGGAGPGRAGAGSAYVVFGKTTTAAVDLAALGSQGYRIDGAASGDAAGGSVAGAGDVNGDGTADVVVGAGSADNNGRSTSGSAYVVFGKA